MVYPVFTSKAAKHLTSFENIEDKSVHVAYSGMNKSVCIILCKDVYVYHMICVPEPLNHRAYCTYINNSFPVCFVHTIVPGGNGKRATCMTIATAVFIWILALICGIPALVGSNVKVNKSSMFFFPFMIMIRIT